MYKIDRREGGSKNRILGRTLNFFLKKCIHFAKVSESNLEDTFLCLFFLFFPIVPHFKGTVGVIFGVASSIHNGTPYITPLSEHQLFTTKHYH